MSLLLNVVHFGYVFIAGPFGFSFQNGFLRERERERETIVLMAFNSQISNGDKWNDHFENIIKLMEKNEESKT